LKEKKSQVFVSEKTVSAGYPFFDGCKKKKVSFFLFHKTYFKKCPSCRHDSERVNQYNGHLVFLSFSSPFMPLFTFICAYRGHVTGR
jgi:hypothetical protein